MYLPVAPNSVSVSQRFVCVALVSPSTNSQDTKSPSRASAPHIETSAENKHTHLLSFVFSCSRKVKIDLTLASSANLRGKLELN